MITRKKSNKNHFIIEGEKRHKSMEQMTIFDRLEETEICAHKKPWFTPR